MAWHILRLRMEERPPLWREAANIMNKQSPGLATKHEHMPHYNRLQCQSIGWFVKNKFDTPQQEVAVTYFEALLPNFSGRTEETHKTPNQYSEYMGRDFNPAPSEYKPENPFNSPCRPYCLWNPQPSNKENRGRGGGGGMTEAWRMAIHLP